VTAGGLLYRCPACGAEVVLEEYGPRVPYCEEHDPPRPMRRVRLARCPGSGSRAFESDVCRTCGQKPGVVENDRFAEHEYERERP
jgi:DNA-directed RNA polymerase subunit RPC12/RpoP